MIVVMLSLMSKTPTAFHSENPKELPKEPRGLGRG